MPISVQVSPGTAAACRHRRKSPEGSNLPTALPQFVMCLAIQLPPQSTT